MILASPTCSSPFPHGEVHFVEDKTGPPNRAYLKLWELFTLLGQSPGPGEFCLGLGGSPGGWSWVLAKLGARVLAVDRSPLDPRVANLPNVDTCLGSAFAMQPQVVGGADWLFWDVACYPERLRVFLDRWIQANPETRLVATVKLQGDADDVSLSGLANLPGIQLRHLFHNKHELTLVKLSIDNCKKI